jgi:serine protease
MDHRHRPGTETGRALRRLPVLGAVLLLGSTLGAVAGGTGPAGATTPGPSDAPGVVLTVPTALGHGYRHGAVPRRTRDVSGVDVLGHQPAGGARKVTGKPSKLDVRYGGGLTAGGLVGAGVTTGHPEVYLVFMGSQWGTQSQGPSNRALFGNDPDAFAPALQTLYAGIGTGGEQWSGTMTQYCDGAPVGATVCEEGDSQIPYPTGGVLAGVWYDNSTAATSEETTGLTGHQLAAEAEAAATHFGNTSQASNRDAQYVIASPTGTDPDGWADPADGYCAYHDDTHDPTIDGGGAVSGPIVAFTNLPYVPDAGYDCGAGDLNSPGTLDGATEAASHEYAETITDQFPESDPVPGWIDSGGEEVADLCAYHETGPGAVFNLTMGDGTVAVQGIWSNAAGGGTGACSDGGPDYTYTPSITAFSPASATAGSVVTVTGENLGTATAVLFDGTPGSITSDAPGTVTAIVPAPAGDGVLSVVTSYGTVVSAKAFEVAPSLAAASPTVVAPGGLLTLTGSGLGAAKKVTVGGRKAVIVSDAVGRIEVRVSAKASSGPVVVTTKYGSASLTTVTVS